jgi:hypothetical protein
MNKPIRREQFQQFSAADLLGEIVTWDCQSQNITVTQVRNALTAAGLSPTECGDLDQAHAFKRACKELKKDRLIEKVVAKGEVITFQFTAKVPSELRIDHVYEHLLHLNTNTGVVECPENPSMVPKVHTLINRAMRERTNQDITRIVQRLFEKNADLFPINRRKGVAYFVPQEHAPFTEKVDAFLRAVSGYCERFPIPKGTASGNASVRATIFSALDQDVRDLEEQVKEWNESTRKDTKERARQRIEVLMHKGECYAEYLGGKREELLAKMTACKSILVEAILKSVEPETAQP